MRLLSVVLSSCFAVVPLHAQDTSNFQTSHLSNGRLWLQMSVEDREVYLAALRDSARFEAIMTAPDTNAANVAMQERWAHGFNVRDYEAELNKLYVDTENVRIPIVLAMRYCSLKLKGTLTKQELEQRLIMMRRQVNDGPHR